jgi:hypothetical protein
MHTWTLVMTHAATADDAKSDVEDLMMLSVGEGNLFDYVGDCTTMTMTDGQKKEFKVETIEELVALYKGYTQKSIENGERRVTEELRLLLMKGYLKHEEAALLINDEDRRVKDTAQEILKGDESKDLPKTLEEMTSGVAKLVIDGVGDWRNMLTYSLKNLASLMTSLESGEDVREAIESPDNHYVDYTLDEEQDKSLPIFYVLADRHY